MTTHPALVDLALRNLLPRVAAHQVEIDRALRLHLDDPRQSAATLGLDLSGRFPELEGVAAALWSGPSTTLAVADEAGLPRASAQATLDLASLVRSSPTLVAALSTAFPQVAAPAEPPLVAVLVADPELDGDGHPVRPGGNPRWHIPTARFEDRLWEVVEQAGRDVRFEVHRGTWEKALGVVPRAAALLVLCHGAPDGALAFERDRPGAFLHGELVTTERFASLFAGARPEVVVVLACHGERAAEATHGAGVPVAVAIGAGDELAWDDAPALAATFLTALLAGNDGRVAVGLAAQATSCAAGFHTFASGAGTVLSAPGGPPMRSPGHALGAGRRLIGREREVADIAEATAGPGLVVVHAAPGQGKTELAREAARRWRLRNPGAEVVAVSLERATDARSMVAAVVAQLPGLQLVDPSPAEVGAAAGRVRRLVVLDNAEDAQAGDQAAFSFLVDAIVAGGRASLVVTTRQAPIGPWPNRTISLGALRPGDGIALAASELRQILGDGGADRRWQELINGTDLDRLFADLGGHPLSVRLAAALLATGETPQQLRRDLAAGRLALGGTSADRQTSLAASLGLSRHHLA
ncbi:MAG: hypothetical protein ACRDY5_01815, partial [Acidimicrobiales bacterium]